MQNNITRIELINKVLSVIQKEYKTASNIAEEVGFSTNEISFILMNCAFTKTLLLPNSQMLYLAKVSKLY